MTNQFGQSEKMVKTQLFLLAVIALVGGSALPTLRNGNDDSLELVHVLFRHGDRTPDRHVVYPNDPNVNVTYYPVGFGQLTNAGKRKEYLVGKALRKKYGKFLGTYTIETIDARCTDYNRTKMSLQLVLASLFPPKDELIWEKHLKWQPVPFNYWTLHEDHTLGDPWKNCPKYKKLLQEFLASPRGLEYYKDHVEDIKYITEKAGFESTMTSKHLSDMYFTLTTEAENGLPLPDWTGKIYPEIIKKLAVLDYCTSTETRDLKRLSSGFLVKKIIDDTRARIKGTLSSNAKMFMYSAHEFNLAFLLRYLGVFYHHVPPYGSYIAFEIHNVNGIRGVKVFYQDYTLGKPKRLKLPNCENFCRFEKFVSLYKDFLPSSEKECFAI